jgi:endonuclease/exonuclease/phosphatase family metal-dependent hydrolase
VALLQEVPPWWPGRLGWECDVVLTSRNWGLPARRWLASRWPDVMRSGGGSSNAILVRDGSRISVRARRRLRLWPERRVVHGVCLEPSGVWVANLHAQVHSAERASADTALAASVASGWAGGAPVVLGGDFNLRRVSVPGFVHAGGHGVDHVFARGLDVEGAASVLDRGTLSDHAPVLARLTRHPG